MKSCRCQTQHPAHRVAITGGPGAGKTALLELARQSFCEHVTVLPEVASMLFSGGFPRGETDETRRAAQRAIYYVQRELEIANESNGAALTLCDRGTLDGVAYWPSPPPDFFSSVGTSLDDELARYALVLHLRTPTESNGYNRNNPVRVESAHEAAEIDARILAVWSRHPRRVVVDHTEVFLVKATRALDILRQEVPPCCRSDFRLFTETDLS